MSETELFKDGRPDIVDSEPNAELYDAIQALWRGIRVLQGNPQGTELCEAEEAIDGIIGRICSASVSVHVRHPELSLSEPTEPVTP